MRETECRRWPPAFPKLNLPSDGSTHYNISLLYTMRMCGYSAINTSGGLPEMFALATFHKVSPVWYTFYWADISGVWRVRKKNIYI